MSTQMSTQMSTLEVLQLKALSLLLELQRGNIGDFNDDETSMELSLDLRIRYFNGHYYMLTGDSSYDTDHRGIWSASSISSEMDEEQVIAIVSSMFDEILDNLNECDVD